MRIALGLRLVLILSMNSANLKQTDLNHLGNTFVCERCGTRMRPEHAHDVCDFCGWSSHCCEGDVCHPIDVLNASQKPSSPKDEQ